jgi:hypothetical protein
MTTYPIRYKVGTNFDPNLLVGLGELNSKYGDRSWRITELYGSLPSVNPIGTARPGFRLQDGDRDFLRSYVKDALELGMGLNYTINTSSVDPRVLKERESEIAEFLEYLSEIGVVRVTVAHPLVAQLVYSLAPSLPIELSTILQIRHPRQLELLKARCPSIQKICLDVFANRDREKLVEFYEIGHKLDLALEVIVNEFCIYECPDRNPCYDLHALDLTKDETKLFGRYPMGNCIRERIMSPIEWLWARFILPQWVRTYYEKFGITSFKITGRTHPTAYILRTVEAYMSGSFTGNLLELWADVENIGRLESEYRQPRIVLDMAKIEEAGSAFLDFYFGGLPVTYRRETSYLNRAFERCREA